jgi:hypothetical protein
MSVVVVVVAMVAVAVVVVAMAAVAAVVTQWQPWKEMSRVHRVQFKRSRPLVQAHRTHRVHSSSSKSATLFKRCHALCVHVWHKAHHGEPSWVARSLKLLCGHLGWPRRVGAQHKHVLVARTIWQIEPATE